MKIEILKGSPHYVHESEVNEAVDSLEADGYTIVDIDTQSHIEENTFRYITIIKYKEPNHD